MLVLCKKPVSIGMLLAQNLLLASAQFNCEADDSVYAVSIGMLFAQKLPFVDVTFHRQEAVFEQRACQYLHSLLGAAQMMRVQ